MKNRILELLEKYINIHSPLGYTHEAIAVCEKDFNAMGLETFYTKKGALIAKFIGQDTSKERVVSAHMDTLGGMVKEILSDGKIKFVRLGGGIYNCVEGENCTIITSSGKKYRGSIMPIKSSTHIYGPDCSSIVRDENTVIIRLDEIISNKEDVLTLGINVGDIVCMDTRFETTESGFIKTRYIDNKASVAIVLDICEKLLKKGEKPAYTTLFYISNYEEMGHGVSNIFTDKTDEFLALDIGIVGEGQNSSEYKVSIAAKDAKTAYDYHMRQKLISLSEENGINYAVDVFNRYASDATQAILTGCDFRFACIGMGVDASHHYERTHMEALDNTSKLLEAYLKCSK